MNPLGGRGHDARNTTPQAERLHGPDGRLDTLSMAPVALPRVGEGAPPVDVDAAAAAVAYVARSLPNATLHSVAKALYFADKIHLSRFGRTIAGDRYIAMEFGPVPSAVYDSLKDLAGRDNRAYPELTARLRTFVRVVGKRIQLIADPEIEWLSESDLEALNGAIELCRDKGFLELTELAHDEAWNTTPENGVMSLEAIARTLPNAERVIEYLRSEAEE